MEILAPAGNMKALKSAVASGADAIYLGSGDFNARSKADNFGNDELRLAVSYCHDRGVRVYLTLNTIVKPSEMARAVRTAKDAADAGIDAFIIQDPALAAAIRKELPDMPLHASTQMGIHNAYGAAFAKRAGFDRVIFSRETLPEDMKKAKAVGIETECFVHGAHCISFSGNCYFSALVSGYSGNRGKCLQLCRKKYVLEGAGRKIGGYMLSAKDICLIDDLDKLRNCGIDSLKIEGRLRSPEYAGTIASAYKRALKGERPDMTDVLTAFNRGDMSKAYVSGDKPDIVWPMTQSNIGSHAARIASVRGKKIIPSGVYKARAGDGFKILRKGRETGSAICNGKEIILSGDARPGDELRLTRSAAMCERIEKAIRACDSMQIQANYEKLSVKNHGTMSDIVLKNYDLPLSCRILRADERTSGELLDSADIIIYAPSIFDAAACSRFAHRAGVPVLLELPVEARGKDCDILLEIKQSKIFDGYVANNVYALEMFGDEKLLLGSGMNSLSDVFGVTRILPSEAAAAECGDIVTVYARETLMNLTHCPARQLGQKCGNCMSEGMTLRDETGNVMTLRRRKLHYCYFELLNSRIRNISSKLNKEIHTRILIDARCVNKAKALEALIDPYSLRFDEKSETYGRWGKGVK